MKDIKDLEVNPLYAKLSTIRIIKITANPLASKLRKSWQPIFIKYSKINQILQIYKIRYPRKESEISKLATCEKYRRDCFYSQPA